MRDHDISSTLLPALSAVSTASVYAVILHDPIIHGAIATVVNTLLSWAIVRVLRRRDDRKRDEGAEIHVEVVDETPPAKREKP